jgi:hypothetical protein
MDPKKFLAELTLRNVYKIAREILGNHFRQPQQSRLELGLCLGPWMSTGERSGLQTHAATSFGPVRCGEISMTLTAWVGSPARPLTLY